MLRHRVEGMTNGFRRGGGADLNGHGIMQHLMGQMTDLLRHGRRKEQRLTLLGQMLENASNVGEKSHIEHLISFIENQHVKLGKIDGALLNMVKQTARTGHNNLCAPLQFGNLRIDTNTAIDGNTAQSGLLTQTVKSFVNLFGQFTGRSYDQSTDIAFTATGQALQNRQCKSSGLSGAGLGQPHHVTSIEHWRNGLLLNGRRGKIASGLDAAHDLRLKIESLKIHEFLFFK